MNIGRRLINNVSSEFLYLIEWLLQSLPSTRLWSKMRVLYWRRRLKNKKIRFIGRQAQMHIKSGLFLGTNFILGDYSELIIADSDPVFIGNDVSVARGTYIRSANHAFKDPEQLIMNQGHESKKISYNKSTYSIVIENNVWIGANVVILSGAHIGTGSVISAGSIVSSIIPPFSIVVGNPARVIANRKKLANFAGSVKLEAHG